MAVVTSGRYYLLYTVGQCAGDICISFDGRKIHSDILNCVYKYQIYCPDTFVQDVLFVREAKRRFSHIPSWHIREWQAPTLLPLRKNLETQIFPPIPGPPGPLGVMKGIGFARLFFLWMIQIQNGIIELKVTAFRRYWRCWYELVSCMISIQQSKWQRNLYRRKTSENC